MAAPIRPGSGDSTPDRSWVTSATEAARVTDAVRYSKPVDRSKFDIADTARATKGTRELIEALVEHSVESAKATEVRERQMLRWTQAGVVLAGIAAVASIIAIIVTLLVA